MLRITSEVNMCFGGSSRGNLVAELRGALCILPLQRTRPSLSRNRRNCRISVVRFCPGDLEERCVSSLL